MRVGIGGFFHETNSFSNIYFTLDDVRQSWAARHVMNERYEGVKAYIGGFFDEAKELGVEVVPAVIARKCPCGHITQEAIETVRDGLVELLWEGHQQKPYDAIAIHLHGAAVADEHLDADGMLLQAVREKFGPDMPIGVVLDLHGNISDTMMACSDLLIGLKTYPHVDEYGAARIMFRQLCEKVRENYKIYKKIIRLPWHMVPAEGLTTAGPGCQVRELCLKLEKEVPELLQATFFQGFPYSDVEEAGVSVVTMARTQETADRCALEIARFAWSIRKRFAVRANSAEEAFDLALQIPDGPGPVVINESSDNTGGGAPGDGTHLLREMLKRNIPGSAFGAMYDPEVAQIAAKAGVGARISCKLGGKMDNLHGEPIELKDAYVKCISDGIVVNHSPKGGGDTYYLGTSACLVVGNVEISVTSGRAQAMDDGLLRMVGISQEHCKIVAVKSSQHFRAWWEDRCRGIVPCDSPGIHCADLHCFDFKNANTNYYPLADAQWSE